MNQAAETEPIKAYLEQLSLHDIFQKNLNIPEYQRCYAWEPAHVVDLVMDLTKREGSYLLGTVVLHQDGGKFHIVDGQQRLVTLTILIKELNLTEILPLPLLDQKFSKSSIGAIMECKKAIKGNLASMDQYEMDLLVKMLSKPKDGLLFSVITVDEQSLELAFSFFDSINSKGLRLSDFDLLKAHHLMFIPADQEALAVRHNGDWQRNDESHSIVFGYILRRIRMWAKFRSRDSWHERPDYDEFRALVEPDTASGAEHRFSRYMQPSAFRSWRRENGRVVLSMDWPVDQAETLLPFEMTQTIEGGDSFFLFARRYHELYESLFGPEFAGRSTASAFVSKLADHINNGHIQSAFCSLVMLYVDKFSDDFLIDSGVCLEIILSGCRWEKDRVRIEGTLDYVLYKRLVQILMDSVNSIHACSQLERLAKAIAKPSKDIAGAKKHYFDRLSLFYKSELGRISSALTQSLVRHYNLTSTKNEQ